MVEIGAFGIFMRTRLNIEPFSDSPLKPTKIGFIFIGPNTLGQAEYLAAVSHVTQAVVRVGSKILVPKVGFKELRLEPKFLNCGLCILSSCQSSSTLALSTAPVLG